MDQVGTVPASSEGRILGKKGMKGWSWGGWGVGVGAESAVAERRKNPEATEWSRPTEAQRD